MNILAFIGHMKTMNNMKRLALFLTLLLPLTGCGDDDPNLDYLFAYYDAMAHLGDVESALDLDNKQNLVNVSSIYTFSDGSPEAYTRQDYDLNNYYYHELTTQGDSFMEVWLYKINELDILFVIKTDYGLNRYFIKECSSEEEFSLMFEKYSIRYIPLMIRDYTNYSYNKIYEARELLSNELGISFDADTKHIRIDYMSYSYDWLFNESGLAYQSYACEEYSYEQTFTFETFERVEANYSNCVDIGENFYD